MKKIYCGKEFNLFHSDYALCGKVYSDGKIYQCAKCYRLEDILNNRIVKKLWVCANCDHIKQVPYCDGVNYRCTLTGWYTDPGDNCHKWDIAKNLI